MRGPVVGNMLVSEARYYRCINTRPRAERPRTCDARYIRADRLEAAAWNIVSRAIRNPGLLSREVQRHVETSEGDLDEAMKKLAREVSDLKDQQRRLIELRQKDTIDQEILESQIAPLKLLCDEKEQWLKALEEQQRNKDAAAEAEEQIAEYCQRVADALDDLDFDGKRATFSAFGVRVEATTEELSITMVVDPGTTTISPSS